MNEEVGRDVAVPATYKVLNGHPQGFRDIMLGRPPPGFYDPDKLVANANRCSPVVIVPGCFLGVMNATGAIGYRHTQRYAPTSRP